MTGDLLHVDVRIVGHRDRDGMDVASTDTDIPLPAGLRRDYVFLSATLNVYRL